MSKGLSGCDTVLGSTFKHLDQEIQSIRVKTTILLTLEGEVACPVLRKHFVVGLAWECADSEQKDVEDESKTEDIADGVVLGLHVFDIDDLGSYIPRGAASDEEVVLCVSKLCQSEISNHTLPSTLSAEDQVFWFQVAMHDSLRVHLTQPLQDAANNCTNLICLELVLPFYLIVQLSSLQQLHYDVKRVLRLEDLVQLHAVAVTETSHYFDLLDQALLSLVLTVGCLLRKRLHCEITSNLQLLRQVHRGKVTLTNLLLRLELLMETTLIQFSPQHLPTGLQICLRSQDIHNTLLPLLKGKGRGRKGEGELEVEVEWHGLSVSWRGLDETVFVKAKGEFFLRGTVGRTGELQLAWLGRQLRIEQRYDCFHLLYSIEAQDVLYSNSQTKTQSSSSLICCVGRGQGREDIL